MKVGEMQGKGKSHEGVERGRKPKQASSPIPPPIPQQILHLSTLPHSHKMTYLMDEGGGWMRRGGDWRYLRDSSRCRSKPLVMLTPLRTSKERQTEWAHRLERRSSNLQHPLHNSNLAPCHIEISPSLPPCDPEAVASKHDMQESIHVDSTCAETHPDINARSVDCKRQKGGWLI